MNPLAVSSTKNAILAELFNSCHLNKMLKKFDAGAGQEDLKSELFLALCQQPDEKITTLHSNNQLLFFATGIVQRMIFQKNSKFTRTYRKANSEFNECIEITQEQYDHERDVKESELADKIDELHWVENAMMRIYLKEGSMMKACKKVGISWRQGSNILKKAKHKLGVNINGKLIGNYLVADVQVILDVSSEISPESVLDLMDEFQEFLNYKLSGQTLPSKTAQDAFIKEIKPAKINKII